MAWAEYLYSSDSERLLERRLAPGGESLRDCLLLVQHPPVYTLGTGSTQDHLKFNIEDSPFEIFRVERGGEVTYHGPGQVVLYPLLDLRCYKQDVHWYMRALEEVVIRALAKLGVRGERIAGLTGVWVGGAKVAAIGVKIRRWHTMHGLALNVHPDLAHFRHIVPCGIGARPVGSLEQLVAGGVTARRASAALLDAFAEVFDAELQVEEVDGDAAAAVAQAEAAGGG
ncbi:lipoate-protein ligase B [Tribonema minus]|uniref:lipoyl(octanoyl) transferase n=1 Tax=Tribonema minus TaxID=303371 RepID=A0A836CFQ0_9STRA|nr:lipoate-protein ligase B [Tribonema minus]